MKILKNLLIIIGVFALSACSNNDEKNIDNIEDKDLSEVMQGFQEKINNIEIPNGLANSSDTNAQTTATYINLVKNYGLVFSAFFNVPTDATAQKSNQISKKSTTSNSQTYTWSDGQSTINYTVTELVDRYTFSYTIESPSYSGKVMDGFSLKDESLAELNMYDMGGTSLTMKWTYINGTATLDLKDSNGSQYILIVNSDNSGILEIIEDNTLTVKCTWNASGNGTLINYETGETFSW
ncbi:hypothetical protein BTO06_10410 [Tenacibaculum sp. SZ-18]|uniref:hypothetical protein n=1 Tax=Tenacibaculum sp. SZ-18 TaxID=754423 RepID=UPI000C2CE91B|nr:hypothetical protein [Tenacibaculum sp. SZ-18]AUC15527.1 hypothetical protein BTO06_10410 [Tenacibaculum sp. SZ-18]